MFGLYLFEVGYDTDDPSMVLPVCLLTLTVSIPTALQWLVLRVRRTHIDKCERIIQEMLSYAGLELPTTQGDATTGRSSVQNPLCDLVVGIDLSSTRA